MKRQLYLFTLVIILVSSVGCTSLNFSSGSASGSSASSATSEIFAMDTIMDLSAYGAKAEDALRASEKEIMRLEKLLSVTVEGSEISAINQSAGNLEADVSEETASLISFSKQMSERTGGAFDISVAPLVNAWGFVSGYFTVPSKQTIDELVQLAGSDRINISGTKIFLEQSGMSIDLGGIGKGYASQRVIDVMKGYGINSALISLGGNIAAIGNKTDGSQWRILIQDPRDPELYAGKVSITDKSVISSGGYERYFEENGVKYHHILDPKTGYPAHSGLLMSTIICSDGATGDALSTATFVMGEEKAIQLWRSSDDFEMVLVTEDARVLATVGVADSFEFMGDTGGYTYETIER